MGSFYTPPPLDTLRLILLCSCKGFYQVTTDATPYGRDIVIKITSWKIYRTDEEEAHNVFERKMAVWRRIF
jgi:hypothetical protein